MTSENSSVWEQISKENRLGWEQFQPGTWAAEPDGQVSSELKNDYMNVFNPSIPLVQIIRAAQELTAAHFNDFEDPVEKEKEFVQLPKNAMFPGWNVQMYVPLYVSNYCVNQCRYCGFRAPHSIRRTKLSVADALLECDVLMKRKYRNILLVAGESNVHCSMDYLSSIIRPLTEKGCSPSVEIAPQSVEGYRQLTEAGCSGLTLFQETYDEKLYPVYHPAGPKSDYRFRYETQFRAAEAGMKRVGFGFLVGLADPRFELEKMVEQAREVKRQFPQTSVSFSVPRLKKAPDGFSIPFLATDEWIIRLYAALRFAFPDSPLIISTRETAEFRDKLDSTLINWVSAGSSTMPGGYRTTPSPLDGVNGEKAFGEQFAITDCRSVEAVAESLSKMNHRVLW